MAYQRISGPFLDVSEILQDRIEELSFVENVQKLRGYLCRSCGHVAISHCIANCGDVFCTKCYLHYFGKPCPSCEDKLVSNEHNEEFESAVLELKVKCTFTRNGCSELISVIDFLKHVKLCKFATDKHLPKVYRENPVVKALQQLSDDLNRKEEEIKLMQTQMVSADKDEIQELSNNLLKVELSVKHIENQNKNKMKQIRKDLMRDVQALHSDSLQHFGEEWRQNKISMLKEIVIMKHEMQESMKTNQSFRTNLEETINSFAEKIDNDAVKNEELMHGMQAEIMHLKRSLQENERSDKTSFDQNKKEMKNLESRARKSLEDFESKSEIKIQEADQDLHPAENEEDKLTNVFTWKIAGIKKKLRGLLGKDIPIKREEWFTSHHQFIFKPVLNRSGPYISIELYFSNDRNSSWPFLHFRKFILFDQSTEIKKQNIELIDRPKFKQNPMAPKFSDSWFFPARLLEGKNKYMKNGEILIEIILEPISMLWKQIQSRDGVVLWRINNYSKKKRDAIEGINTYLTTKPFKTSQMGYTVHGNIYLNGYNDGEGKYISIWLYFLLGEHDASLSLPFECKITICLMDQSDSPTKQNIIYEYADECEQILWFRWFETLFLQSTVESPKYIKNDAILIKTIVKIV